MEVRALLTDRDNKVENIIQDNAERRCKLLEACEVWTLHDAVDHRLHDEARHLSVILVRLVHANERLQKPDHDDEQQREEDQRLFHHDLEHHQHRPEEAERIEVKKQAHPEHGRAEGQEIIAQLVEPSPLALAVRVIERFPERDHPRHERYRQQGVQRAVEHVPKAQVMPSYLPQLVGLVADEAERHDIQYALHHIQVARGVDRIDCARVQCQKEHREEDLHGVLVAGGAHAVRVQVGPVVRRGFGLVLGEGGGIRFRLDEPATPEVGDAALVAGGPEDEEGVLVDGALDDIGGGCWLQGEVQGGVALQ